MSVLNSTTRRQLLDILAQLPGLDSYAQRTQLIGDLPQPLRDSIERSNAKAQDLDNIVDAADLWWPDKGTSDPYPLRQLIQAAGSLFGGPEHQIQLQRVLDVLPVRIDPQDQATLRRLCPYPGMVPFTADDARFFYGRDTEIDQLLQRLRHQRFLLVIGPSGSGKSSLVLAGLLPKLVESSHWPLDFWLVRILRPGNQPMAALAEAIGRELVEPIVALNSLIEGQAPAQRLLLVVDQFEELFTLSVGNREQQSLFISALKALSASERCAVVLTMRADFYPDLMTSDLWPVGEGERLEIAPLKGASLRQAILRPAKDVGVEVEQALVERLLADAADEPGSLPLLQETLVLLWHKMQGRTLTLANYDALGRDGRSGLAIALTSKADATLAGLTQAQQALARRIFLRLIQFVEGRSGTRRQQPLFALKTSEDDPLLFDQTLDILTTNRLLTLSGEERGEAKQVDLAHEALINSWPTLHNWLAERRSAEETRRRLEDKGNEWVRLGRGEGGLLDEAELSEAERWLQSPDATELGGISPDLHALVAASRTELEQRRQLEEAIRQRELEQALALAEEQRQRADEQAKSSRRLRSRAIGLAVVALLALVALVFAVVAATMAQTATTQAEAERARAQGATTEANKQAAIALSRQLVAQALNHTADEFDLALLLGLESDQVLGANNISTLPEVRGAISSLLQSHPHLSSFLPGHSDIVNSVAFSPDGKTLASGSYDGTIILWDVATGQQIGQPLTGHSD
ncbi:MAG: AAA family ATPase, partial [Chloroflexia bacterium]